MTDLQSELQAWCNSYVSAFSAYDAEGISSHWVFPALISSSGRSIAFKTSEQFDKNTSYLLHFYKTQQVHQATREIVRFLPMSDTAVAITVSDKMLTEAGDTIVEWEAAYVLQRADGKWRAVFASADGELDAWKKRGTPIGAA